MRVIKQKINHIIIRIFVFLNFRVGLTLLGTGQFSGFLMVWEISSLRLNFSLEFTAFLDIYSLFFCFTVLTISARVLLFSFSYISHEKFFIRFHLILILFVLSMLILILSPNTFTIFLG